MPAPMANSMDDDWTRALERGEADKPQIEARSGPAYTETEVARLLGCSERDVRALVGTNGLIAYLPASGNRLYPAWQFSGASVCSWVHELIEKYGGNGWGLIDFLTVPRRRAGEVLSFAHLENLRSGRVAEVLEAAARSNPD